MHRRTLPVGLLVVLAACGTKERKPRGDDDSRPNAVEASADVVEASASASATASATETFVMPQVMASAPSAGPTGSYTVLSPSAAVEARRRALRDARDFGMMGLLTTSPSGRPIRSADPAQMWGDEIGDAFGAGGLGLSGVGGGGGTGSGIGLGSIGHGSGGLSGAHRSKPPSVRMGATSVSGALPPEVIQRIVRQNFGRFRLCYENGLRKDPTLAGRVTVTFTIGKDGSVTDVGNTTDLADKSVAGCVGKAFFGLSFPQPEKGTVKVTYPISFSPGDSPPAAAATTSPKVEATAPAPAADPAKPMVNGKLLAEVTTLDVEKALRATGCTDVSSKVKEGTQVVVFTVTKDKRTFTITFVPPSAGASALKSEDRAALSKTAIVKQDGAFFLAIESDDPAASRALLDLLVKTAP